MYKKSTVPFNHIPDGPGGPSPRTSPRGMKTVDRKNADKMLDPRPKNLGLDKSVALMSPGVARSPAPIPPSPKARDDSSGPIKAKRGARDVPPPAKLSPRTPASPKAPAEAQSPPSVDEAPSPNRGPGALAPDVALPPSRNRRRCPYHGSNAYSQAHHIRYKDHEADDRTFLRKQYEADWNIQRDYYNHLRDCAGQVDTGLQKQAFDKERYWPALKRTMLYSPLKRGSRWIPWSGCPNCYDGPWLPPANASSK